MFWKKKQTDSDALDYQLAQVSSALDDLEVSVEFRNHRIDERLRRLDNQLREIHARLDRMEGIR